MPKKSQVKVLSIYELMQMFPGEQSAIDYLAGILWPDGTVCPYCHGKQITTLQRKNYHRCRDCDKVFTIRVGTVFERSHIPLHKWLVAMYLMVTARKGISSMQLSKELGITQRSAWFLEQRIRIACGPQTDKILSGIVEADETYIGGLEKNKHKDKKLNQSRGTVGKTPVFGMRERDGHVVAKVVKGTDALTLQNAVKSVVTPGSTVCTDEHGGYLGLHGLFVHKTVNHKKKKWVDGMAHTNGIESVWSIIKRMYHGTYHWWSPWHSNLYLNECAFRLNEGNVKYSTADRLKALVHGTAGKRLTYKALTSGSYRLIGGKP